MTLTITEQKPERPVRNLLQHTHISGVTIMFEDGAFLAVKNREIVARLKGKNFEVRNREAGESVIFQHAKPEVYWTLRR